MRFDTDPAKKPQKGIFSRKIKKPLHTPLNSINGNVRETPFRKHLGLILDTQLCLQEHPKAILNKVNKTIGLTQRLKNPYQDHFC